MQTDHLTVSSITLHLYSILTFYLKVYASAHVKQYAFVNTEYAAGSRMFAQGMSTDEYQKQTTVYTRTAVAELLASHEYQRHHTRCRMYVSDTLVFIIHTKRHRRVTTIVGAVYVVGLICMVYATAWDNVGAGASGVKVALKTTVLNAAATQ